MLSPNHKINQYMFIFTAIDVCACYNNLNNKCQNISMHTLHTIHTYMYTHIHAYIYANTYTHYIQYTHICTYTYTQYTYICMCTYTHTYTHTIYNTHLHIHTIHICDLILENRPCTHLPGFQEIQIWNIQSIIAYLCLVVAT